MLSFLRLSTATAVVAAAVLAGSASATPTSICGEGTYAYAGFDGYTAGRGVSATIAQAGPVQVRDGHVAGWIGVVEPNTSAAWLQVGLSALPGDATSGMYYEVAFPGHAPTYHLLRRNLAVGERHRFAVLELTYRPDWWRVWVDGRPVTAPLHLRGSHDRWIPQVLGESWAGTASGICNIYSYAFSGVSLLASTSGRRVPALADANYAIVHRSGASFVAASIGTPATS
jgi:hypothetical protein